MKTITIPVDDDLLLELRRQADAQRLDLETTATLALMIGVYGPEKAERLLQEHVARNKIAKQ